MLNAWRGSGTVVIFCGGSRGKIHEGRQENCRADKALKLGGTALRAADGGDPHEGSPPDRRP